MVIATLLGCAAEAPTLRASKPEVRKQIVTTIENQLAAFRKNDLVTAYAYASSALRAVKPIEIFGAIVQENYPEIWANTRAEFGIVRDDGAAAAVVVHVFSKDADASYDYTLVKENGRWRVHGVLRHSPVKEEKV